MLVKCGQFYKNVRKARMHIFQLKINQQHLISKYDNICKLSSLTFSPLNQLFTLIEEEVEKVTDDILLQNNIDISNITVYNRETSVYDVDLTQIVNVELLVNKITTNKESLKNELMNNLYDKILQLITNCKSQFKFLPLKKHNLKIVSKINIKTSILSKLNILQRIFLNFVERGFFPVN